MHILQTMQMANLLKEAELSIYRKKSADALEEQNQKLKRKYPGIAITCDKSTSCKD